MLNNHSHVLSLHLKVQFKHQAWWRCHLLSCHYFLELSFNALITVIGTAKKVFLPEAVKYAFQKKSCLHNYFVCLHDRLSRIISDTNVIGVRWITQNKGQCEVSNWPNCTKKFLACGRKTDTQRKLGILSNTVWESMPGSQGLPHSKRVLAIDLVRLRDSVCSLHVLPVCIFSRCSSLHKQVR